MRSILLRLNVSAAMSVTTTADSITTISSDVIPPKRKGVMVALVPKIKRMFAMFEPRKFPKAISVLPFRADTNEAKNSGSEVPAATNTMPITASLSPTLRARTMEPSRNRSEPHTRPPKPTATFTIARGSFSPFVVSLVSVAVAEGADEFYDAYCKHHNAYRKQNHTPIFGIAERGCPHEQNNAH